MREAPGLLAVRRIDEPRRSADVVGLLASVRCHAARLGAVLPELTFALAIAVLALQTRTPILSYDDIFRTAYAHEWARQPYFFTERLVWLPFPLMLAGLLIRATGEAFWTTLALDVAAGAAAVWYVHRLATLLFGRLAGWVAASLFGLTPWIVFLSLSRHSEPIMLALAAAGVFHWVRWTRGGDARDIALAGIALALGVLTRYEMWPLGAALPVHVALARFAGASARAHAGRAGRMVAMLPSALPLLAMAIWVSKNVAMYRLPLYGGALGFLLPRTPIGAWAGIRLAAAYLAELNPVIAALGLIGAWIHRRSAPLLVCLLGLSAIVPWFTLSFSPIAVALQERLMVLPLMLLAPLAAAALTRTVRRDGVAVALAVTAVVLQLAIAVRTPYPSAPLPMTLLARKLAETGIAERFEALYVQSPNQWTYPYEVKVGLDFRRPVRVLLPDDTLLEGGRTGRLPHTLLILNDGRKPEIPGAGEPRPVAQVGTMIAWAVCTPSPTRTSASPAGACARSEPPPHR